jgi:Ricin-type beta-trefoil lectin domain
MASGAIATHGATNMNRLLFASLLLLICALLSPGAHAAQLVGAISGECIDIPHQNTADGTPMSLFHCHGSPNQQWTISNGQITGMGGSCLDVQGSAAVDGAQIIIVACNGRPSQKWSFVSGQIVGIGGKCIDTSGGGSTDQTPVILMGCSATPSQQWSIQ